MSAFEESDATAVVEDAEPPPPPPPSTSDLRVYLDGVDVSSCALEGSVTRRLNRPALATIKIPMDCTDCSGPGARMKVSFDGGITTFFHGMVMDWELDGDEDFGYITMNASDPMELWEHRPARDGPGSSDPGDFSNPLMFTGQDYSPTGSAIIEQCLLQSADGSDQALGEGDLFLTMGSFATGGKELYAGPQDWPMTIMQVANLIVSAGTTDIIITPTDPGGGVMGTVDVYNGTYGTNHSSFGGGDGTVDFEYGTGALNVRALRWNQDMSNITNKLWYYGGPKISTISDPDGIQHWCWNIQGDDCCFTGVDNPPHCVCVSPDQAAMETAFGAVDTCRDASRSTYGVRMDVQVFDAASDNCVGPDGFSVDRDLYRWLWLAESWARCNPRSLVHITPTRGTEIGTFDIGDLVGVTIGSGICGGDSGAQRVYQYTISWTADGPFELSELQTASDAGILSP